MLKRGLKSDATCCVDMGLSGSVYLRRREGCLDRWIDSFCKDNRNGNLTIRQSLSLYTLVTLERTLPRLLETVNCRFFVDKRFIRR